MLARLRDVESAQVLWSLLKLHPHLVHEAEEIARVTITGSGAEAIAEDVEQVVLGLGIDAIGERSGRKSWGYVDPTQAAWDLLDAEVAPFVEEMERHIELGFETPATTACAGIVLGLYRCRGKNSDQVLGWAPDFPTETAAHAVATLARESMRKRRQMWRLPNEIAELVPEWAEMIGRASGAV